MRETPSACSHQRATARSVLSSNGAAPICTPSGRPDSLSPEGRVIVGKPLAVQGDWNIAGPVVVRSLGAGVAVVGVSSASNGRRASPSVARNSRTVRLAWM